MNAAETDVVDLLRRLGRSREFVRVFRAVVGASRNANTDEARAAWSLLEEALAVDLDSARGTPKTIYRGRRGGIREHALKLAATAELTADNLREATGCAHHSSRQFMYGLQKEGLVVRVERGRYRLVEQESP